MIKSFADRRTQELYAGGNAKRFPPDVAKRAARKLEYINLAIKLDDLRIPLGTDFMLWKETEKTSIPFPLTTSGASAFGLLMAMPMPMMSKFVTTIK
jgi:hypothetical protein